MKSCGWTHCFLETVKECLTNLSCFSFFLVAIFFYSFYYAWPYTAQLPDHISTVVVDLDNTPISRELIRGLQAVSQIDVKGVSNNPDTAIRDLKNGKFTTLITIPNGFMKDAITGVPTALELVSNGAFIVKARSSIAGAAGPLQEIASTAIAAQLIKQGVPISTIAASANKPPAVIFQPMYNTVSGYLNFAVPIVFCIIFQTVTLAGVGTLINEWFCAKQMPFPLVRAIQSLPYLFALYLPFFCILLFWTLFIEGASFAWHGINSFQNIPATLATCVFLSMAVCALALVIAFAFKRANYAVQTVVLTSLPCVFITGDLFPLQNIPDYMNIIAFFIPSTPAVHAMLRASQAGASIGQIMPHLLHLLGLTVFYLTIAYLIDKNYRNNYEVISSPYSLQTVKGQTIISSK